MNRPSDPQPSEIMILLLGETGAGKSSFINLVSEGKPAIVSEGMEACTKQVELHAVTRPDKTGPKFLLVDTPGFNQTKKTDDIIKREIVDFLSHYDKATQFGAILYFAPLNDPRPRGIQVAAPKSWPKPEPRNRVAVIAVGGNDVSPETARMREDLVKKAVIDPEDLDTIVEGDQSNIRRFDFGPKSAWSILDSILGKGTIDLGLITDALSRTCGEPASFKKSKGLGFIWKRLFG